MLYIALILMAFVLLKIAQEDWVGRSVHLYWFVALFSLLAWITIDKVGGTAFLLQYLGNVLFITVQLLLLNLYFCVKHRRMLWIFDQYLGWGDVAFLFAIAGTWKLGAFFVFFVGSLLLVLVFALLYLQKQKKTVPLAGLQAILFLCFYLLSFFDLFSLDSFLPY